MTGRCPRFDMARLDLRAMVARLNTSFPGCGTTSHGPQIRTHHRRTTGAIGWLTFDNPSKLNALSPGMSEDRLTVIEAYDADPAIKVVDAGAGEKASSRRRFSFEKTAAIATRPPARKIPIAGAKMTDINAADRDDPGWPGAAAGMA